MSLASDVRYSLRLLARSPAFTAIAILSLALGVGANTAIFTLINDLMLKQLPVGHPDQLVSFGDDSGCCILGVVPMGTAGLFSYDFYRQIEKQHQFFEDISASAGFNLPAGARLRGDRGPAASAFLQLVSGNYFSVLQVRPVLGRTILPSDEEVPGRNPVTVLSYHYWQTTLAGDPSVIGRSLTIDGNPFTIVGVAPPKFFGLRLEAQAPDFWLPLTMQQEVMQHRSLLDAPGMYWLHLVGRRNPGANLAQAQDWFNSQLRQSMPARDPQIHYVPIQLLPGARAGSDLREQYKAPLETLMGVVVLVLLIACANLANFLLARAVARQREISTRLALGSTRSRIIRQVLIETLLLSLCGAAFGVLIAFLGTRALIAFVVAGSTYTALDPHPDMQVLLFTLGITVLTGLLFAMAPAIRVSRIRVAPALKAGAGPAPSGGRIPKLLVGAQVTLSLVLLVGAGLFLESLRNLERQDLGFESHQLLVAQLLPEAAGYVPRQLGSLYENILDRVQALPGVRSAALSGVSVIHPGLWGSPISIPGYATNPEQADTLGNFVTAGYFETVGIPVLQGRPIGQQDTATSIKVAVVNQTFAEAYFPRGDAIGRSFTIADPGVPGVWQIVGIARNAKYGSPREAPQRMIYLPLLQIEGAYAHALEVQTVGAPSQAAGQLRRALAQVDPNLAILNLETIRQQVNHVLDQEQLISQLCAWFAVLALLLTTIGLYGVMSYNVVRRTQEIGIRMALGAQNRQVLWLVLKESLLLLAVGLLIGIPATIAAGRLVASQLFGLTASDPRTWIIAILTVSIVALLAGYFPARRATRVDPIVALRDE